MHDMSTFRKIAAALCVATLLLSAACGQKPSESPALPVIANLPGCQAALAKVDYGTILLIPDETKSVIESYRSAWKDFCGAKAVSDKPTMADLILKAKTLEGQFGKIIEAHNRALTTEQRYAGADAVSDLVSKKYPSFVPAFEGSYWEQEYFRPSTAEFKKHAQLGTPEDKLFFEAGMKLESEFPPWMDRTWDYGGCWLFGDFKWTETLDRLVQLKKSLHSDIYKKLTADYEASMMEPLTSLGQSVCTCKRKESVLEDLQRVLSYLEKEPAFSSYLPMVRSSIDALETKKIIVNSEAEKHCSGG